MNFAGGRVAHSVFEIASFGSGAEALRALFAGLVAVAAWAVFAWYFGIPTSESHALLSGLAGSAASVTGAASFNAAQWSRVALGLPRCGISAGMCCLPKARPARDTLFMPPPTASGAAVWLPTACRTVEIHGVAMFAKLVNTLDGGGARRQGFLRGLHGVERSGARG